MGESGAGRAAEHSVRLHLLGCFRLTRDGTPVDLPEGTQRLLALLGVRGADRRVSIASLLWPEATERAGLARLRTALWRLPKGAGIVEMQGQRLALAPSVRVDTGDLEQRADTILGAGHEGWESAGRDILRDAFPAELLPGWYDDWVLLERERLRQMQLHALESLSTALLGRARFGEALEAGLRAVCGDPLRESARRRVIAVHLAEDNLVEALQHYRAFAAVLREEIGVDPSPELHAEVHRALAARRSDATPRPSPGRSPLQVMIPASRQPGRNDSEVRRPVQ